MEYLTIAYNSKREILFDFIEAKSENQAEIFYRRKYRGKGYPVFIFVKSLQKIESGDLTDYYNTVSEQIKDTFDKIKKEDFPIWRELI